MERLRAELNDAQVKGETRVAMAVGSPLLDFDSERNLSSGLLCEMRAARPLCCASGVTSGPRISSGPQAMWAPHALSSGLEKADLIWSNA